MILIFKEETVYYFVFQDLYWRYQLCCNFDPFFLLFL